MSITRERPPAGGLAVAPFEIHVPEEDLVEMRRRIAATRWPTTEIYTLSLHDALPISFSCGERTWMKWMSTPSISVMNCGSAFSLASPLRQS